MRIEMPEKRKKYDREFREGAVRIVEETNKPIAQVARDLGVNEGTLGNWVTRARAEADGDWPLDDALELVPSRRGGGGVECGDSGLEAGDIAQGTLELAGSADEGLAVAVPLALVLGIAALIASALSVAVFGLFGVEVLLGVAVEIAFASAGGALAFRARREGWLLHAAGRTWRPMLILLVLAAVLGVVIDRWMPQAGSLPQAVRLLRGGTP